MKKSFLFFGFVFTALIMTSFAFGQESINIDTDYINSSKAASYKEWTGGYAPYEINTAEQIRDIGRRLGRGIKYQESVQNDPNPYNKGNPAYKYSSARIYGKDKRGADVILIGRTATVDTIKCLKMILRGYLEAAFGYSDMDARAVAENICYWNSNNYNNTEMFSTKFENALMTVFDGYYKNIGLSESYTDWKESILIIPHAFVETATAIEETETESVVETKIDESEIAPAEDEPEADVETDAESDSYEYEEESESFAYSNDYNSYNRDNSNTDTGNSAKNKYTSSIQKSDPFFDFKLIAIIAGACVLLIGVIIFVIVKSKE